MTAIRHSLLALILASVFLSASCIAPAPAVATIPDACTDWRWVGIKTDPNLACPTVGGGLWTTRHLLDPIATTPASLPPGLRPFCLYEATGTPTTVTPLLALIGSGLDSIARDCTAVGPAADELDTVLWPSQNGRFASQNGAPLPDSANPVPQIRLSLLDTSPTTLSSVISTQANSSHGRSLAGLAEEIVCGPGLNCRAAVSSRLALPIVEFLPEQQGEFQVDSDLGGYVGTIGQLAEAIAEEVKEWRTTGTEPRLVLNLSLGWSGERFGGLQGLDDDPEPPITAVYRALEDAACRGTLVVAAAGNRAGKEDDSSPLLPAGWEEFAAPSAEDCIEAIGGGGNGAHRDQRKAANLSRPLLWAAGGIDAQDRPLANARALPKLVAFSEHAVAEDPLDGPGTPAMTGSSVASIAVAASAAALWHEQPALTAAAIMDRLYLSGRNLQMSADFFFGPGSPPPRVRRLNGCAALANLCNEQPGLCLQPVTCIEPDKGLLSLTEEQIKNLSVLWGPGLSAGPAEGTLPLGPPCTSETLRYITSYGAPLAVCPFGQYPAEAALPWTDPQPGLDPCPNCTLIPGGGGGGTASLYLAIPTEFEGVLTDPVLELGPDSLALHVGPLVAGDAMFIENLDLGSFEATETVPVLTFLVDGSWSTASPLVVAEAKEE